MPYKLRKAPKRELYWVVTIETGKKHSKDPIPMEKAKAQMRVLESALHGGIAIKMNRKPNEYGEYIIHDVDGNILDGTTSKEEAEALITFWYKLTKYNALKTLFDKLNILLGADQNNPAIQATTTSLVNTFRNKARKFLEESTVENEKKRVKNWLDELEEDVGAGRRMRGKGDEGENMEMADLFREPIGARPPGIPPRAPNPFDGFFEQRPVNRRIRRIAQKRAISTVQGALITNAEKRQKTGHGLRGGITFKEFHKLFEDFAEKYVDFIENKIDLPIMLKHTKKYFRDLTSNLNSKQFNNPRLLPLINEVEKETLTKLKQGKEIKLDEFGKFTDVEQLIYDELDANEIETNILENNYERIGKEKSTRNSPKEFPGMLVKTKGKGKSGGACKPPYHDYSKGKASAFVITCIDPRYTFDVAYFLQHKKELHQDYDLFTLAGASVGATKKEWTKTFFDNLELGIKLHGITEVWCFDHLDCGMYKATFGLDKDLDPKIHIQCMDKLKKMVHKKHPGLKFREFMVNAKGHISSV